MPLGAAPRTTLNAAGRRWGGIGHAGRSHGKWTPAQALAEQTRIYGLLATWLPADFHQLLVGQHAILSFLRTIGVTDYGKRALRWSTITSWRRHHGFPLLPATRRDRPNAPLQRRYTAAVTSTSAVIAWILSRTCTGTPVMAYVHRPDPPRAPRTRRHSATAVPTCSHAYQSGGTTPTAPHNHQGPGSSDSRSPSGHTVPHVPSSSAS